RRCRHARHPGHRAARRDGSLLLDGLRPGRRRDRRHVRPRRRREADPAQVRRHEARRHRRLRHVRDPPRVLLLHFELLPAALAIPVVLCPVLASAYGFCRTDAKTADHFFTGFPSYWNIVAFYLYVLDWPPTLNAAVVVGFAVAVFVPVRYV